MTENNGYWLEDTEGRYWGDRRLTRYNDRMTENNGYWLEDSKTRVRVTRYKTNVEGNKVIGFKTHTLRKQKMKRAPNLNSTLECQQTLQRDKIESLKSKNSDAKSIRIQSMFVGRIVSPNGIFYIYCPSAPPYFPQLIRWGPGYLLHQHIDGHYRYTVTPNTSTIMSWHLVR